MTPNSHRINIVLLVVKSVFATNNVKLCCDSTRKVLKSDLDLCISRRVPHGTRGLKLYTEEYDFWEREVASRMGRVD